MKTRTVVLTTSWNKMGYRFFLIIMSLGRTHVQRVGHEHSPGCDSEDELVMPGVGDLLSVRNGPLHVHRGDGNGSARIQRPATAPASPSAADTGRRTGPPHGPRWPAGPGDQLQVCGPWRSTRALVRAVADERGTKDHNYTTFEIINTFIILYFKIENVII